MTRPYARLGAVATAGLVVAVIAAPAGATSPSTPHLTGLSAASGPLVGGERISLHGNGFDHVTKVVFGGATAHGVRVTSTHTLSVVVPKHKAGRVDIRILTTTGESTTVKADRFTYIAPPTITTLTPAAGPTTGGTRITVKGKNFTHVKAVLFGTTKGTKLHVLSATTLLVTTPTHSPGLIDVHVRTSYGTSKTAKTDHFAYVAGTLPTGPLPPAPPTPPTGPAVAPTIATISLPDAVQATTYVGATLSAASGVPPYHWSAHGLPGGLTLSPSGVLSGTTWATIGEKPVRVTLTDAGGLSATSLAYLRVTPKAGQLYGWGPNANATLGDGTQTDYFHPVGVPSGLVTLSTCSEKTNSFMARKDGSVWGWGRDDKGQVGDGGTTAVLNPKLVSAGFGVVAVACAADTMYELTSAGQVYALGVGTMGETGAGSTLSTTTPTLITTLAGIVAIAAGDHHALALESNGSVVAWGDNTYGQLGAGADVGTLSASPVLVSGLTDITDIAAGGYFSFALHRDGTVSGWGVDNPYVYLGDGTIFNQFTPVTIPGLADITQVATSGATSFAVKDDGTLWAWGDNGAGEVGDGTTDVRKTPVQAVASGIAAVGTSQDNAFALTTTGAALAWGAGDGTGQPSVDNVDVPTAAPWLSQTVFFGRGQTDGFAVRLKALEE
ncbi:hypothetical protein acdb102_48300 [Acidothermaceae bacterium B102]|nr:hypothetical protein acdb102_48300 [Acidothermaceae bacterium B102]